MDESRCSIAFSTQSGATASAVFPGSKCTGRIASTSLAWAFRFVSDAATQQSSSRQDRNSDFMVQVAYAAYVRESGCD